jgi:hypothetical protein
MGMVWYGSCLLRWQQGATGTGKNKANHLLA